MIIVDSIKIKQAYIKRHFLFLPLNQFGIWFELNIYMFSVSLSLRVATCLVNILKIGYNFYELTHTSSTINCFQLLPKGRFLLLQLKYSKAAAVLKTTGRQTWNWQTISFLKSSETYLEDECTKQIEQRYSILLEKVQTSFVNDTLMINKWMITVVRS